MSKNENMELIADTSALQEESLVRYMAALGYDPVFNKDGELKRFYQPHYANIGVANVSLASAIKKHNYGPQRALNTIRTMSAPKNIIGEHLITTRIQSFNDLIRKDDFLDATTSLFAGQARIVQRVKAQGSKGRGLIFNEDAHKIEFNTRYDKRQFGEFVSKKLGGEVYRTIKNFG